MAFEPYKEVDVTKVAKLSFPCSACNYIYWSDTSGQVLGTIYETDKATYEKITEILEGDAAVTVQNGDKVFVLPGHPLTKSRVKEYLKGIGASLVNDVTKATVIAGSDSFADEVAASFEDQARNSSLMFYASELYKVNPNDEHLLEDTFESLHSSSLVYTKLRDEFKDGKACYCSKPGSPSNGYDVNLDQVKEKFFISPKGIEVMHEVLANNLKVVSKDTICSSANSGLKLEDESTYSSIYQMLDSGDEKSRALGIDILIHCDLTGNTHYNLWRLARDFGGIVEHHDRSKGLSYFLDTTKWYDLRHTSTQEFLLKCEKEDCVTSQMVEDQMPKLFAAIKNGAPIHFEPNNIHMMEENYFEAIDNGDFSYTIKLKDRWHEYLKTEEDDRARL